MRLKIKKSGNYRHSKKYLKLISEAETLVYDVAINSPTTHAVNLSIKEDNNIYLKREDLQPILSLGGEIGLLFTGQGGGYCYKGSAT